MEQLQPHITASLAGLISGFLVSIPVGPINVTILNEGAKRGFFWAFMIGLGAMAMDLIYCALAFASFSEFFTSKMLRATMELLSFLLMLYLGMKYLLAKDMPSSNPTLEKVEHKLHPHAAFWIGFVRVLGNPAVLLFWITVSASFISHEWIDDTFPIKAECVIGTFFGGLSWFVLLSYLVSRGKGKFSTRALMRMSHLSGASLLIAGLIIGYHLIGSLALRIR